MKIFKNGLGKKIVIVLNIFLFGLLAAVEQPLVVIIPSYNNLPYIERMLNSVFMQKYDNYRVIYIDDCSTDGSLAYLNNYISAHNLGDKVFVIANNKRQRKLKNIYSTIHQYCLDDEIAVMMDCDDWLAHDHVFSLINRLYENFDIWMTYGQDCPQPLHVAQQWGISTTGCCAETPAHIIAQNSFRNYMWVYMHLRTFRTWLFKNIKAEDLIANNVAGFASKFYPACNDYAMYYPMIEMGGHHVKFNPEVVYYYNCDSPLNGFKIDRNLQIASALEIKTMKKPYQPLAEPEKNRLAHCQQAQVNVILFSSSAEKTDHLLEEIQSHIVGVSSVCVVTHSQTERDKLSKRWPEIKIYNPDDTMQELINAADYHLLLHDTDRIFSLQMHDDVTMLERTFAYCFLYEVCPKGINAQELFDNVHACKFSCNPLVVSARTTHGALYRSADLQQVNTATIKTWAAAWEQSAPDLQKIALFHW